MKPILLNVAADGSILYQGAPWLLAAFLIPNKMKLAEAFTCRQMPYAFTVDTGFGVVVGAAGDYWMSDANGKQFVCKAADLNQYVPA